MVSVVYLLIPAPNHNYVNQSSNFPKLYIFWFLHQTTTMLTSLLIFSSCISFDSYTKPQRRSWSQNLYAVVYLLIPTPNHNCVPPIYKILLLYIFWFLHQTTTENAPGVLDCRCISFDSYTKPQLRGCSSVLYVVVYLLIPTPNHNLQAMVMFFSELYIFWFLHQTTTV